MRERKASLLDTPAETCHQIREINTVVKSKVSKLHCISLNARSLPSKMDSLLCTVEALKPYVIGVSESWTNNEISDGELNIEGYDLYRKDRNNGHKGGGVLLYVKSNIKSTMFAPITDFPEQVGLWCKLPKFLVPTEPNQHQLIGVCYRTPTQEIFDIDLDKALCQLLREVSSRHVLFMGDFKYGDIDWTNPYSMSVTVASKEFIDCLDDRFLTQHVKEPTRITSNGSSILDLVITNDPDMVEKVEIIGNLEGSDHQMCEWVTSINLQQCEYLGTTKDYSRGNYDGIKDRMRRIYWENILNCEAMLGRFYENFT